MTIAVINHDDCDAFTAGVFEIPRPPSQLEPGAREATAASRQPGPPAPAGRHGAFSVEIHSFIRPSDRRHDQIDDSPCRDGSYAAECDAVIPFTVVFIRQQAALHTSLPRANWHCIPGHDDRPTMASHLRFQPGQLSASMAVDIDVLLSDNGD